MALDLTDTIEGAIEDAALPEEVEMQEVAEDTPETAQDAPETKETDTVEEDASAEVKSPGARAAASTAKEPDEFEKKHGIPSEVNGRENRIPYSRVRKIIEKREKELETQYTPKLTELETKIKTYDTQFENVRAFEKMMVEEKPKFLQLLRGIPGYAELLDKATAAVTATQETVAKPGDDMPQPDQELSDGSKVYSLDGLKALNEWNRAQARKEVLSEVEKTYGPIRSQFESQQKMNAMLPVIEAQIAEARTWPQFTENEAEIGKALDADAKLTLEGAYRKVVFPKLTSTREQMRAELIAEIKKAPRSTSVPSTSVKANTSVSSGPRDLESVIRESLQALK